MKGLNQNKLIKISSNVRKDIFQKKINASSESNANIKYAKKIEMNFRSYLKYRKYYNNRMFLNNIETYLRSSTTSPSYSCVLNILDDILVSARMMQHNRVGLSLPSKLYIILLFETPYGISYIKKTLH